MDEQFKIEQEFDRSITNEPTQPTKIFTNGEMIKNANCKTLFSGKIRLTNFKWTEIH